MAKLALGRRLRIKDRSEFSRVFTRGRALRGRVLALRALPNERGATRVGVTAGRRFGEKPARNRMHRLLREAFRLTQHELPRGWDLVLSPLAAGLSVEAAREDLRRLASRLGDSPTAGATGAC